MAAAGSTPGTPGTPRVLRAMNDRAVLDLLVVHGPLTRTRIGELTGLSKPTTSQLLGRLEAAGLVHTTGSLSGRPGPNALLYEIDPGAGHVAALSADPTGITALVADITGTVLGTERVEADAIADDVRHRTAQLVAEAVDGALRQAGLGHDDLRAAVIGTPGAIDPHTGQLRYAPHLPGWHSRTLRDDLAAVLGTPVAIENDVNLAAVAEQYEGAAQDHDNYVLAWLDEGVGAAIVLGGTLLRGATGGAGEIGYMPLPGAPLVRGGPEATLGPHGGGGGFQSLVSAPVVRELAGPDASLADAFADDTILAEVARRLATGIAAVIAVVDPELVVLSGAVAQAGGDKLRGRVEEELTGLALPCPQVRVSELDGDPILTGALRSALTQARDQVFDTA
ncbi:MULTISPECIES: ROK family transcriptional regulator [Streptomyces]|uniref:ROK family transcriptional regulator n=1 Tax=Streptomyces TaxID=1883 RepID=UPI001E3DF5D9|nr:MULTISPECIES: ROK family transcriptional regulator [Streptomyces]UFQ15707.1 ROK family transcriptional regulator [Streptomyces huasconensis]WCL85310.1 ROK family transcriptional regulator [Streptomyces sp. JCM 35825]